MSILETWGTVFVGGFIAVSASWLTVIWTNQASHRQRKIWLKKHSLEMLEAYEGMVSPGRIFAERAEKVRKFREKYLKNIDGTEGVKFSTNEVSEITGYIVVSEYTSIGFDLVSEHLDIMPDKLRRSMMDFRISTILYRGALDELAEFQRNQLLSLYLKKEDVYTENENRILKVYQTLLQACMGYEAEYLSKLNNFKRNLRNIE
jgi:hypothetical protein